MDNDIKHIKYSLSWLVNLERNYIMNFWWTLLAASLGQIITFILVEGFKQSYWGKNCREELTRVCDGFSKHVQKLKKEKQNG